MNRWLAVIVLALGLGTGACGSSEKKDDGNTNTWTPAADAEAIVGTWGDGSSTVTFDGNGNYKWDRARPCGSPPCPTTTESGTYQIRSGKLYLDPQEGTDEVLEFMFGDKQGAVTLTSNKDNASWTLSKR